MKNSLNRTMQYGNKVFRIVIAGGDFCLNRTMQYGNYTSQFLFHRKDIRLNRTMQYGNRVYINKANKLYLWFKSYYVVWKHSWNCNRYARITRLNRTMQYGN